FSPFDSPPFFLYLYKLELTKSFTYAARSACSDIAPSARLRSHNSSRMICRNWDSLHSSPTERRSRRERTLLRSTIPRSTTCSCLAFRRARANGRSASCHGTLNKPLDRRSCNLRGHSSEKAERINLRGSPGRQRTSAGTVMRNSTRGRWANG